MLAEYFCISARWETGRNSPADARFDEIDRIGGMLADAKAVAQSYLRRHVAQHAYGIEWVEGIHKGKKCYYGRAHVITFLITS